ncbi:MAG: phosphopentomutase [Firmicutes bacterium]|nr:phosphopentomutase [Bacillota bacterium]
MKKRVFMIVLDSVGVGALPDWRDYDTEPGNTLGHTAEAVGGLSMPHCQRLGLGNIVPLKGIAPTEQPEAAFGRAPLTTCGKDTTAGHWEMMGIILKQSFPVFPEGFPGEFVKELEDAFGTEILCNLPYSGTAVIEDYGEEHMATKKPIVYTSADSVLQIACHEDLYSPEELYVLCKKARELAKGPYGVGRVIARPFIGKPHAFERTKNRKDFSFLPPCPHYLEALQNAGITTYGVGKIGDIFAMEGLTESFPVKGNPLCLQETLRLMDSEKEGFFFINLVDFDMLYGHRNDAEGYAKALEAFDAALSDILPRLREDDLLIITADHGNDPTTESSDHNREYVPVLMVGAEAKNLGTMNTMADLGATVYHALTGKDAPEIPGENVL